MATESATQSNIPNTHLKKGKSCVQTQIFHGRACGLAHVGFFVNLYRLSGSPTQYTERHFDSF